MPVFIRVVLVVIINAKGQKIAMKLLRFAFAAIRHRFRCIYLRVIFCRSLYSLDFLPGGYFFLMPISLRKIFSIPRKFNSPDFSSLKVLSKRRIIMKKYIFFITFIVSMLLISSYALAGQACCVKQSCKCAKATCCTDGKCSAKCNC